MSTHVVTSSLRIAGASWVVGRCHLPLRCLLPPQSTIARCCCPAVIAAGEEDARWAAGAGTPGGGESRCPAMPPWQKQAQMDPGMRPGRTYHQQRRKHPGRRRRQRGRVQEVEWQQRRGGTPAIGVVLGAAATAAAAGSVDSSARPSGCWWPLLQSPPDCGEMRAALMPPCPNRCRPLPSCRAPAAAPCTPRRRHRRPAACARRGPRGASHLNRLRSMGQQRKGSAQKPAVQGTAGQIISLTITSGESLHRSNRTKQ